ncbi:MAG: hypothetical protein A2041_08535 [Bacteroidetes bacterium GWA2_31_9b]|nr:MAG: hypothetical protein A2041_08535 [Bacteroidetes bacterium GWA2_31_9b]
MRNKIGFIILFVMMLLHGCKSVYQATYQHNPIVIDGISSDWQSALLIEKNGIVYGITNDSASIYLLLNIGDENIQKKMFMSGLTVWIDTTGKNNAKLGIVCPIKKDIGTMKRGPMQQSDQMKPFTKNPLIDAEFIGFEEKKRICVASSNPYGIEISINSDKYRSLIYELNIPFKSLNKEINDFKNNDLSLGIIIEGVEMPKMEGGPNEMGGGKPDGMPGGNMGTPPSGGGPGRMPGGMPGNSSIDELKYPTKFWIKNIILSQTK